MQAQVSQNTEALQGAQMEKSDLSRQIQTLEIELASQQSLVSLITFEFECIIYNPFYIVLLQNLRSVLKKNTLSIT